MSINLDDTCLDNPKAKEVFQKHVTSAEQDGWLDEDWDQTPTGKFTNCMK